MWIVVGADPGAHLFTGLAAGVTREAFEAALGAGEDVSAMLGRHDVGAGDVMYLPSGRVHAIGAGNLILEIQQNSDTTYRVFDFNRPGLDGELRELHVPESLASIDFGDVEPELLPRGEGVLAENPCFVVARRQLAEDAVPLAADGECALIAVLDGEARAGGQAFGPGSFFLLTADAAEPVGGPAEVLVCELPG